MNLGAPTHVLLLHVVVVLAPLLCLGLMAYAWRGRAWRWLELPLAVLGVIVGVMGPLTGHFGEDLLERVQRTALVDTHERWGSIAEKVCVALLLVTALQLLAHGAEPWRRLRLPDRVTAWFEERPAARAAVGVLTSLVALGGLVLVALAGHSGAVAVWSR